MEVECNNIPSNLSLLETKSNDRYRGTRNKRNNMASKPFQGAEKILGATVNRVALFF